MAGIERKGQQLGSIRVEDDEPKAKKASKAETVEVVDEAPKPKPAAKEK